MHLCKTLLEVPYTIFCKHQKIPQDGPYALYPFLQARIWNDFGLNQDVVYPLFYVKYHTVAVIPDVAWSKGMPCTTFCQCTWVPCNGGVAKPHAA